MTFFEKTTEKMTLHAPAASVAAATSEIPEGLYLIEGEEEEDKEKEGKQN